MSLLAQFLMFYILFPFMFLIFYLSCYRNNIDRCYLQPDAGPRALWVRWLKQHWRNIYQDYRRGAFYNKTRCKNVTLDVLLVSLNPIKQKLLSYLEFNSFLRSSTLSVRLIWLIVLRLALEIINKTSRA